MRTGNSFVAFLLASFLFSFPLLSKASEKYIVKKELNAPQKKVTILVDTEDSAVVILPGNQSPYYCGDRSLEDLREYFNNYIETRDYQSLDQWVTKIWEAARLNPLEFFKLTFPQLQYSFQKMKPLTLSLPRDSRSLIKTHKYCYSEEELKKAQEEIIKWFDDYYVNWGRWYNYRFEDKGFQKGYEVIVKKGLNW